MSISNRMPWKTANALIQLIWLARLPTAVIGQQFAFTWGFNTWTNTSLPQCQPLQLFVGVDAGTVKPSPPYYLLAYEVNGSTSLSSLGSDISNMYWTAQQSQGSQLVLAMLDDAGNSGGILNGTYTIAQGSNNCSAPATPKTDFSVSTNASTSLDTCSAIEISIKGGTPPYTISIIEENAVAPYNTTLSTNDDTYLWVNNLFPGVTIILAASDSAGAWGKNTELITLTGNSNTHCSYTSTASNSSSSGNNSSSSTSHSGMGAIIAGVIIGIAAFAILGWFFIYRRRRRRHSQGGWDLNAFPGRKKNIERSPSFAFHPMPSDAELTPFELPPSGQSHQREGSGVGYPVDPSERNSYTDEPPRTSPRAGYFGVADSANTSTLHYPPSNYSPYDKGRAAGTSRPTSSLHPSSSGGTLFTRNPDASASTASSQNAVDKRRQMMENSATSSTVGQRPVYQHADAGSISSPDIEEVEEIPPAYPGPNSSRRAGDTSPDERS
ncbi:hypothetical protein SISNIDRAFT_489582 [Sistotremastrum niveocremeum HHB9708]|uniref:Mid2 domain-containing protein n=1 Tax=Sistotremastrum niveocremeum HHB9708 TaxID=1314777 RepID=A0A164PYI5_9AGAM|nr:hypothetical protein SISNIDRAFT_489582 [Sistotremastrum niveocremeum HHB9708]